MANDECLLDLLAETAYLIRQAESDHAFVHAHSLIVEKKLGDEEKSLLEHCSCSIVFRLKAPLMLMKQYVLEGQLKLSERVKERRSDTADARFVHYEDLFFDAILHQCENYFTVE